MKVLFKLIFWSAVLGLFLSPLSYAKAKNTAQDRKISMDFKNASLKDVLKAFSIQSGLNFIAGEDIKDKKVTLYMQNVPTNEALNTILKANNLTYEQPEGTNIFIVKEVKVPQLEVETISRIYFLNYADASKIKDLFEKMSKEKQVQETTAKGTTITKTFIQGVLSKYGKIAADKRTNSLIITDIPSRFPMIENTIAKLDEPTPEVMIEAEVLEVATSLLKKIGVDYSNNDDGSQIEFKGAINTTAFPFGHLPRSLDRAASAQYGTISTQTLDAVLKLLESDNRTKILARPRILTLNNQTAEIKITADTAVASTTATTASEGIATQTVAAERIETGVVLTVTPVVNKDGYVTISVEPKVTEPQNSKFFPGVYVDPHTRSAKTTVRVLDGDTVVIGGLISRNDNITKEKIPFLGDIPLLGNAFRYNDTSRENKELIIFITPHVVKDEYYKMGQLSNPSLERELSKEGSSKEKVINETLKKAD